MSSGGVFQPGAEKYFNIGQAEESLINVYLCILQTRTTGSELEITEISLKAYTSDSLKYLTVIVGLNLCYCADKVM